mmetsp:Transcript_19264/g.23139  ORF Transcript_19264/g.23139 Transcript_19264/m.23139 type:complete len:91 (-) Transcript_19264:704-976(-)
MSELRRTRLTQMSGDSGYDASSGDQATSYGSAADDQLSVNSPFFYDLTEENSESDSTTQIANLELDHRRAYLEHSQGNMDSGEAIDLCSP